MPVLSGPWFGSPDGSRLQLYASIQDGNRTGFILKKWTDTNQWQCGMNCYTVWLPAGKTVSEKCEQGYRSTWGIQKGSRSHLSLTLESDASDGFSNFRLDGDFWEKKLICNSFRAEPQPFEGLSKSLKWALFGQQMPFETLHMDKWWLKTRCVRKQKQHEHLWESRVCVFKRFTIHHFPRKGHVVNVAPTISIFFSGVS